MLAQTVSPAMSFRGSVLKHSNAEVLGNTSEKKDKELVVVISEMLKHILANEDIVHSIKKNTIELKDGSSIELKDQCLTLVNSFDQRYFVFLEKQGEVVDSIQKDFKTIQEKIKFQESHGKADLMAGSIVHGMFAAMHGLKS